MAYKLGFVMEQTLGQVTHTRNFQGWVAEQADIEPTWILVGFDAKDRWSRVPVVSQNWTLRASLQARDRVKAVLRSGALDGLLFHTHVTALFAHRLMTRIPTVVSMDATSLNFDRIGHSYNHVPSRLKRVERLKHVLTRRTFTRAQRLVIWHQWGKRSLVEDYGAPPEKVSVIPPGIDLTRWTFHRSSLKKGRVRLLFVGGDFRRKGGETLLTAFSRELARECELDIVTRESVDTAGMVNVRVHHGLGPNAPELMALYARADIFVFPTLGDVLPLAIMEAMAAGLPVITTDVGALTEEIENGVNGFLIPVGDVHALADVAKRLVADPELRRRMGAAGRRVAELRFNASRNYHELLAVCKAAVDESRAATA